MPKGKGRGGHRETEDRAAVLRAKMQAKLKDPNYKSKAQIKQGAEAIQEANQAKKSILSDAQQLIDVLVDEEAKNKDKLPQISSRARELTNKLQEFMCNIPAMHLTLCYEVFHILGLEALTVSKDAREAKGLLDQQIRDTHLRATQYTQAVIGATASAAQSVNSEGDNIEGRLTLRAMISVIEDLPDVAPQEATNDIDNMLSEFRAQDLEATIAIIKDGTRDADAKTQAELEQSLEDKISVGDWGNAVQIMRIILGYFVTGKDWRGCYHWLKQHYEPHEEEIMSANELFIAYSAFCAYEKNKDPKADALLLRAIDIAKTFPDKDAQGAMCAMAFYHNLQSLQKTTDVRIAGAKHVLESFAGIADHEVIEKLEDLLKTEEFFAEQAKSSHTEDTQLPGVVSDASAARHDAVTSKIDVGALVARTSEELDPQCEWNEQAFHECCRKMAESKVTKFALAKSDESIKKWFYEGTIYDTSKKNVMENGEYLSYVSGEAGLFFAVQYSEIDPGINAVVRSALDKGIVSGIGKNGIVGDKGFYKIKLLGQYSSVRIIADKVLINSDGDKLHLFALQTNHNGVDRFRDHNKVAERPSDFVSLPDGDHFELAEEISGSAAAGGGSVVKTNPDCDDTMLELGSVRQNVGYESE